MLSYKNSKKSDIKYNKSMSNDKIIKDKINGAYYIETQYLIYLYLNALKHINIKVYNSYLFNLHNDKDNVNTLSKINMFKIIKYLNNSFFHTMDNTEYIKIKNKRYISFCFHVFCWLDSKECNNYWKSIDIEASTIVMNNILKYIRNKKFNKLTNIR